MVELLQRGAGRLQPWTWTSVWLDVVRVLVELPVGDPRPEALDLVTLVGEERVDERLAEEVAHLLVVLEGVEGLRQLLGELLRPALVIAVADEGCGRLDLVADPQQRGRQHAGDGQVRVGARVAEPELEPAGGPSLGRDADHGAAVDEA